MAPDGLLSGLSGGQPDGLLPAVCNANETMTRYFGKIEAFSNLTKHHIAI
ncbi:hypothetical protein RE628_15960 [Paenibacillus sp. D2_2]|nr:hypothetical protein [Paenibacillus sp. D2_2]WMT39016.1 hypothetical protein RE628_15960 [Paenibacillus sp. D2_2]